MTHVFDVGAKELQVRREDEEAWWAFATLPASGVSGILCMVAAGVTGW
ncbi:MAG: hypothetical protein ACREA0_15795 [bacterium]